MQRENHRDRRPYRIFHPLSHRVQKQLPYKYSVSPAFYKKSSARKRSRRSDARMGRQKADRRNTMPVPPLSAKTHRKQIPSCRQNRQTQRFRQIVSPTEVAAPQESARPPPPPPDLQASNELMLPTFPFRKNRPTRQPPVHRKALWQTHSARKSAAYPYAPSGRASAHKNSYSACRAFPCRAVSPSGSGSTPRISETVCPRRAFEPAGTDWLRTVPAPENETIIP